MRSRQIIEHPDVHLPCIINLVNRFHGNIQDPTRLVERFLERDVSTDLRGNQSSSALQSGVSREVLLSGYGRMYPSEIVSKFGPKT